MNIENLQTIKVDGNWYLGQLVELEGSIEIGHAQKWMDRSEDAEQTFNAWIKGYNLGELGTIKCSMVTPYLTKPLTVKQVILFEQRIAIMGYVKKTAIAHLENDFFDRA